DYYCWLHSSGAWIF
nr:immunoglobulin light chain junction region [Macaca mulatta]